MIDKAEEDAVLQVRSVGLQNRKEADWWRAKGDAVHPLEAAREDVELTARRLGPGQHMRVQQRSHRPASRVSRDQQAVPRTAGVLPKELLEPVRDRFDGAPGDAEESRVAEVTLVIEEPRRWGGAGVEIDGPVHEGGGAADGKDDGVHVVHGEGLDGHGLGGGPPVGGDVRLALCGGGLFVDGLGVLGGEGEERPGWEVAVAC